MRNPLFLARRLAGGLLLALAFALPASTFAQAPPEIRVGAGPDDPSIPLLYAAQSGMYAKAGLNVEIVRLSGAAAVAAALAGGSLELGKGAPMTIVPAIAKGLPFTIIGASGYYVKGTPQVGLIVLKDSPIKTAKDLDGKTLAGISLQDQNVLSTLAWMDKNGGDSTSLKYIEIPASASLAAMEQGRIAASAVYEPVLTSAIESGKIRVLGDTYEAVGNHWPVAVLFGTTKWIDANRDAVRRFLTVTQEANVYVTAHEADMQPLQAQYGGVIDPALFSKMHHAARGVPIEPSDLQPVLDVLLKYKVIAQPIRAADIICTCALRRSGTGR
jgi:NitT/TauT family transport system substrate-binding protein